MDEQTVVALFVGCGRRIKPGPNGGEALIAGEEDGRVHQSTGI
jgi:hypothetical protein